MKNLNYLNRLMRGNNLCFVYSPNDDYEIKITRFLDKSFQGKHLYNGEDRSTRDLLPSIRDYKTHDIYIKSSEVTVYPEGKSVYYKVHFQNRAQLVAYFKHNLGITLSDD